jgi:hypothetical protein
LVADELVLAKREVSKCKLVPPVSVIVEPVADP